MSASLLSQLTWEKWDLNVLTWVDGLESNIFGIFISLNEYFSEEKPML